MKPDQIEALQRGDSLRHRDGDRVELGVRKDDGSGWWLAGDSGGGLSDAALASDEWELSVKRLPIVEFRALGFLQEANRLFFHPHGLALEVVVGDDGAQRLGGVWDYRGDPEGVAFGPGLIDPENVARVEAELERHVSARLELFGTGSIVQEPDA